MSGGGGGAGTSGKYVGFGSEDIDKFGYQPGKFNQPYDPYVKSEPTPKQKEENRQKAAQLFKGVDEKNDDAKKSKKKHSRKKSSSSEKSDSDSSSSDSDKSDDDSDDGGKKKNQKKEAKAKAKGLE